MDIILSSILAGIGAKWFVVVIIFLVAAVFILSFLGIKSRTSFNLSIGPFKINLGGKNNTINIASLVSSILEIQETHIRNILAIENGVIKKQIHYTEQRLLEVKFYLLESYSKLLFKKISRVEDVKTHKDYRYYQKILNILVKEIKDTIFYFAFVENHFDQIDNAQWTKYINDKSIYVINFINDYQDFMIEENRLVSRKEISDGEKEEFSNIKDIVKDIFNECREFSINGKKEAELMRIESRKDVKMICKNMYGFDMDKEEKSY